MEFIYDSIFNQTEKKSGPNGKLCVKDADAVISWNGFGPQGNLGLGAHGMRLPDG
jgi:hypothetical protein